MNPPRNGIQIVGIG